MQNIYTVLDTMKYLRIGKNKVLQLLANKEIEAFKIGNRWKIPEQSIWEFVEKEKKRRNADDANI